MADATRLERVSHVVAADRCELHLEGGRVRITKETAGRASPTTMTFPVEQVRGTTLERPAIGQPGWLHVSVVGGSPAPSTDLGATLDPYTVPVTSRNLSAAKRLARLVEKHVRERGLPAEDAAHAVQTSTSVIVTSTPTLSDNPPGPPPPPPHALRTSGTTRPAADTQVPQTSIEDGEGEHDLARQLRQLSELHDAGALTDEEFQRAKTRVLDS